MGPFNGDEYSRYLKALGINQDHSTPKWPQGNAEVERFNQPLGRALTTAKLEGKVWQQELNRFLLQYRTTPHATTKGPPAELLFNRVIKGKLPTLEKKNVVDRHREAKENEQSRKTYNKSYADNRRFVRRSDIKVGDCALVKQEKQNKLTPRFNQTQFVVVQRNRSRVTAEDSNKRRITRNVSHFKRLQKLLNSIDSSDSDDMIDTHVEFNPDDETIVPNERQQQQHNIVRRSSRLSRPPFRFGEPILPEKVR